MRVAGAVQETCSSEMLRGSGRWFPEKGCVLEHQIVRFAEMILRDRRSTSCDLASLFRGRRSTLHRRSGKIARRIGTRPSLCRQLSIFEGSLAELSRFQCCQRRTLRKSRRIASFLMLSTSKIEDLSRTCFVFKLADRHHFPSSPLPFATTSLSHHFPKSPHSLRHHFPKSPHSHCHHLPSSPLPKVTTLPSSPLPKVTTSLRHHLPSSPPFLTISQSHHFPRSPLPFVTTLCHSLLFFCDVLLCDVKSHTTLHQCQFFCDVLLCDAKSHTTLRQCQVSQFYLSVTREHCFPTSFDNITTSTTSTTSTPLQLQLQPQLQFNYIALRYTTLHPAVVGEVTTATTPKMKPPFDPSVDSLRPCITTTHLSYNFLSLKPPPQLCAALLVHNI